ncbi:MAG: radical SAM protein [Candidatus Omnitrophica bacterium]|nr:radical SAM protein [Candidatus Omnitrophota bacterium]
MRIKYGSNNRRLFSVFLDNIFVYLFSKNAKAGPLLVTWDINHKCNIKCVYCECWKNKASKNELSFADKVTIVKKLGKAKVWYLSFCGGEPLMEKKLDLLIKEAKGEGMLVNISTNGLLLKEHAEMLVETGVNHITISVESHIPGIHDSIRGYKGLLKKIEKAIESIKQKRKGKIPFISIRALINKKTHADLFDYVRYWTDKVDDIMFKPICENTIFFKIPQEMKPLEDNKIEFETSFSTFLKEFKRYDNPYHRRIPDYFFNKISLRKYKCFAGTFFADIDPEGNLYQCGEQRDSLGNLIKEEFLDIWNSNKIKCIRNLLKKDKCLNECWAENFLLNIF